MSLELLVFSVMKALGFLFAEPGILLASGWGQGQGQHVPSYPNTRPAYIYERNQLIRSAWIAAEASSSSSIANFA